MHVDPTRSDGMSRPLRALALDGGAIRGYYTARLIERALATAGIDANAADVGGAFDVIVGTSAGAILGASLAAGVPVARVCSLYRTRGASIFPRPCPLGWRLVLWSLRHWRTPPADTSALRGALRDALGGETLGALYMRRHIALCVTSTDITTSRARVFATPHRGNAGDSDVTLVDACVASSSAPTLLAPAAIGDGDERWADGGVWANNPTLVALAEALALCGDRPVELLSIGTCPVSLGDAIARERGKGLAFWTRGVRALQISADTQARATAECAHALAAAIGGRVRIYRLRDPDPDAAQAAELRLDNASPAAFAAMDALAERAVAMNADSPGLALLSGASRTRD